MCTINRGTEHNLEQTPVLEVSRRSLFDRVGALACPSSLHTCKTNKSLSPSLTFSSIGLITAARLPQASVLEKRTSLFCASKTRYIHHV